MAKSKKGKKESKFTVNGVTYVYDLELMKAEEEYNEKRKKELYELTGRLVFLL